jgi:hypothetical protein
MPPLHLAQPPPPGALRQGRGRATHVYPVAGLVEARGEMGLLCQAVGRHFEPHKAEAQEKPVLEVVMGYDRT